MNAEMQRATPSSEELWSMLQEEQRETDRLESELEQQREEKRSLAGRVAKLSASPRADKRKFSRAGLLKAALAGAAGLAGAGMLGWADPEIAAADSGTCGSPFIWDQFQASGTCPDPADGIGFDATPGTFAVGVAGLGSQYGVYGLCKTSGTSGSGVYGASNGGGAGVHGETTNDGAYGVLGEGPNGVVGYTTLAGYAAVYGGAGTDGTGVYGIADGSSGVGVSGQGGTGRGGEFAGHQSQLSLVPSSANSPPTSNGQAGDLFLDAHGGLWLCTAAASGSVWKPLSAVVPITPVRVLDTRTGTGGYNGPQGVGTALSVTMLNNPTLAGAIPAQSSGVIGTLRAYAPTGAGYLTAYPGSGTPPTASNVNFYPNPSYPTTYAVADNVMVGLDNRAMSIYVGGPAGSATQVVFDVSGYIQ